MSDCPEKIVINKKDQFGTENQYSLVAVSDTTNCLFKSLDYEFLPEFCNLSVKQSFVPLSNDDKNNLMLMFSAIQVKTDNDYPLYQSDIHKIIGWIKIAY